MAQCVGDRGMGAHRVPGEDEGTLPHRGRDDPLEVRDQSRVSIALAGGGRVGLAVAAGVVDDNLVTGSLQRPRAVMDVAAGGGDAVAEHDRRPLPRALATDRRLRADLEGRRRGARRQPTAATARWRSSTDS